MIEKAGIIGNIQQGSRPGRRTTDSLFILRTIIEKSLKAGAVKDREISLIFLDLSKAYDCVPHRRLWDKLLALGFHLDIVNLLISLYRNSTVKVVINGHLTAEVSCQQGIKQGCVLSPLVFILYMAEVGSFLRNNMSGVTMQGVYISGLLYVYDLIFIGRISG